MKKSIGIIGGGIAGLSFALCAQRTKLFSKIVVFQKQKRVGGRVYSQKVKQNSWADFGANILDFQNQKQRHSVSSFINSLSKDQKLIKLQQPFLIYEDSKIRKGDYQKDRFYYQNGFEKLISDIILNLDSSCTIIYKNQIIGLCETDKRWSVRLKGEYQGLQDYKQTFDNIVIACPAPNISTILNSSASLSLSSIQQLNQYFLSIQYTKQISAAYTLRAEQNIPFSCILFKNHNISFICSHLEKYKQNLTPIMVLQMSQHFSQAHFDSDDHILAIKIFENIPQEVKKIIGNILSIKKWQLSLIKQKKQQKKLKFDSIFDCGLYFVGDTVYGRSRVTSSIFTSLQISQKLEQKMKKDKNIV